RRSMAFGKGARVEVASGMVSEAGRRSRAPVPGSGGPGELRELLHGPEDPQQSRWRPPAQPSGPINASTGPPPPLLYSKTGVARDRRQTSEDTDQRRQFAEESAKAFHDARVSSQNARGKAFSNAAPFAVQEGCDGAPFGGVPAEGVLRERNRSRPSSRELEAVKADSGMTSLLREIEETAAEARRGEAEESFRAARSVAEQVRTRNRGGAGIFSMEAEDHADPPAHHGYQQQQQQPQQQFGTMHPSDLGPGAADSFQEARAGRQQALGRNRGEADGIFGSAPLLLGQDEANAERKRKKKPGLGTVDITAPALPKDQSIVETIEKTSLHIHKSQDPKVFERLIQDKNKGKVGWEFMVEGGEGHDYYLFCRHCNEREVDPRPLAEHARKVKEDRDLKQTNAKSNAFAAGMGGEETVKQPLKVAKFKVGELMEVIGVKSKPDYNGKIVKVLGYDAQADRYEVRFEAGRYDTVVVKLKEDNLMYSAVQQKDVDENKEMPEGEIPNGTRVEIRGLQSDAAKWMNGQKAIIVQWDKETERYEARGAATAAESIVQVSCAPATSSRGPRRPNAGLSQHAARVVESLCRRAQREFLGSCIRGWVAVLGRNQELLEDAELLPESSRQSVAASARASRETQERLAQAEAECRALRRQVEEAAASAQSAEAELLRRSASEFRRLQEMMAELQRLQEEAPRLQRLPQRPGRCSPPREVLASLAATASHAWLKLCVSQWFYQASHRRLLRSVLDQSREGDRASLASRALSAWWVRAAALKRQRGAVALAGAASLREAEPLLRLSLRLWRCQAAAAFSSYTSPVSTQVGDFSSPPFALNESAVLHTPMMMETSPALMDAPVAQFSDGGGEDEDAFDQTESEYEEEYFGEYASSGEETTDGIFAEAPLMRAVGRLQQWSLQRLMLHGLELRCEQRLGRICASKVQAVHAESAVGLEAARRSFEDELRTVHGKADSSLKLLAGAHAREVERSKPGHSGGSHKIGPELQPGAEVHALSYLEVATGPQRLGGSTWRMFAFQVRLANCRKRLACQKLATIGVNLLRSRSWAPWQQWQVLEQRSLIYTVRQVDEAHQSRELDHLREELRAARLEADVQRDSFVSELAALQSQSSALKEANQDAEAKELHRSWHGWAEHQRFQSLKQMLACLREVGRSRAVLSTWQCLAQAAVTAAPLRTRADLCAQAVVRLREKSVTSMALARQRRPLARLAAVAAAARQLRTRQLVAFAVLRRPECDCDVSSAFCTALAIALPCKPGGTLPGSVSSACGPRRKARSLSTETEVKRRAVAALEGPAAESCSLGFRKVIERGISLGEFKAELVARPYFQRCFSAWRARASAPRRLGRALLCFAATVRRHRRTQLSSVFGAWRVQFCQVEKMQRLSLRSQQTRVGIRLLRSGFRSWLSLDLAVLRRAHGASGLRSWRGQAARISASADASARGQTAMHRALNRQKGDCERLVELRSRECAARTAKVLLHAWSCASAAERAHQAQRLCAARSLLRAVATLERHGRRAALERWRALAAAGGAEVAAASSIAAYSRAEKLERIRQGGLKLQSLLNHRQTLGVCKVRSLDASAAREQRRLRADCDGLRAQLVEEEAFRFSSLEASMAERSDQTREEANAILVAVRKERSSQAETLQQAEDAEARAWEESAELREELRQALARISTLESERRAATKEVGLVRSELSETRSLSDQTAQAELRRERAFHEQAQALQQQALTSGLQEQTTATTTATTTTTATITTKRNKQTNAKTNKLANNNNKQPQQHQQTNK
ncbi:unnamed protein product, partial [Polarella glacialis]